MFKKSFFPGFKRCSMKFYTIWHFKKPLFAIILKNINQVKTLILYNFLTWSKYSRSTSTKFCTLHYFLNEDQMII